MDASNCYFSYFRRGKPVRSITPQQSSNRLRQMQCDVLQKTQLNAGMRKQS